MKVALIIFFKLKQNSKRIFTFKQYKVSLPGFLVQPSLRNQCLLMLGENKPAKYLFVGSLDSYFHLLLKNYGFY